MTAGPHTDEQLYGQACSHWLTTAIKVYLPHLILKGDEYAIVDERAGVDGVGTGMTLGWHAAIIVAEATDHGIKAANQIAKMVKFFGTPYEFALNKVRESDDIQMLHSKLEKPARFIFTLEPTMTRKEDSTADAFKKELSTLDSWVDALKVAKDERLERTKNKVLTNKQYKERV
jgi:CO dehydrogenase nickel-insertion accessory protein CooC1